ncbi:hypothetical protein [Iamia sp.]|uniref:hypothetical protein n=1 Tax=Iamia sp. TaxID=2722710 RepID=UPI002CC28542|nr:hypothetical protein [Iamia sp.]HXH58423.1 hypothetical protein [Iamia sp.]
MVDHLAPTLLDEATVLGLTMAIDDPEVDVDPPMPWPHGEDPLLATVSVWLAAYGHRGAAEGRILAAAADDDLTVHGYLVSESLYTDYGESPWSGPRDWPDGQRSPGVLTVGLLQRPPEHERTAWVRHWHDVQSPESAELQPRTRYVRNLVVLALDSGAPPIEGIVDEAWPSKDHVRVPDLFYRGDGDPARVQAHVERMLANVTAFLDLTTFRTATMGEYLFRTPAAR